MKSGFHCLASFPKGLNIVLCPPPPVTCKRLKMPHDGCKCRSGVDAEVALFQHLLVVTAGTHNTVLGFWAEDRTQHLLNMKSVNCYI